MRFLLFLAIVAFATALPEDGDHAPLSSATRATLKEAHDTQKRAAAEEARPEVLLQKAESPAAVEEREERLAAAPEPKKPSLDASVPNLEEEADDKKPVAPDASPPLSLYGCMWVSCPRGHGTCDGAMLPWLGRRNRCRRLTPHPPCLGQKLEVSVTQEGVPDEDILVERVPANSRTSPPQPRSALCNSALACSLLSCHPLADSASRAVQQLDVV